MGSTSSKRSMDLATLYRRFSTSFLGLDSRRWLFAGTLGRMLVRRLAPSCLLALLPGIVLAAPPEQPGPVVQRPSEAREPVGPDAEVGEQTVTEDTANAADEPAEVPTETPTGAGTTDPTNSPPATETETQPTEEKDLSNLLVSDEPDQGAPRVRVSNAGSPSRVDSSERLRNYYARTYRPAHNPSRLWFAARGAYALSGTTEGVGGGRMAFVNAEIGQTWNFIGYGVGAAVYAGGLTFGQNGVEKYGGVLVGGGPSLGLGRLGLFGRGYLDFRVGYNFFYAPVLSTREGLADPPDAAPHGPKVQVDVGLLLHDSESRRFRHGFGASVGWQLLVHSFAGPFPIVNTFNIGIGYFFG
jgi:hypothetical protein